MAPDCRLKPPGPDPCRGRAFPAGFTLAEMLVATAILLIVVLILFQVLTSMTSVWHNSTGSVSNFEAARAAFTTINIELSRATLHTYLDYINDPSVNNRPFGQFRSSLSAAAQQSFVPYGYARASDLHFVCGPTPTIMTVIPTGSSAQVTPGDAVFFQAPLGVVSSTANATDKYLQRSLNDVGFYIQYSNLDASALPPWLSSFFGGKPQYGFRLVECIEPTEQFSVYQKETAVGNYSLSWIPQVSATTFPTPGTSYVESVLAEDVVLLLFRPRLTPVDEQVVASQLGVPYSSTTQNSIISPNYVYDSRAWQPPYTFNPSNVTTTGYAMYMRNQLPPIVDVVMVSVDPSSFQRLQGSASVTPPAALCPANGLFASSANLDSDLAAFQAQLSANHIRYRFFRAAVQMQTAAWVNE
jgi:uncharacterized protein (TIGR02599 family)